MLHSPFSPQISDAGATGRPQIMDSPVHRWRTQRMEFIIQDSLFDIRYFPQSPNPQIPQSPSYLTASIPTP